ncbi:hypothetical protein [Vibrio harveyi]|uniref:hypothetical protein n=1 Tax=Vibrio harveyi TaxID=669 RepID=UPI0002E80824|nr:hypothetical protein [Vibrio harveyi]
MTAIKINENTVGIECATQSQLDCQFSKNKLDVITLDLQDLNVTEQKIVEGWLAAEEVEVFNPFTEREYKAKTHQRSTSFQTGRAVKSYKIELTELEEPIQISQIELNGQVFDVVKYQESIVRGTVSKEGVIKVHDLNKFRELFFEKSINVLRVGVDEEPVTMRFGSLMHWSEHSEDDDVYYKQIFRLFDVDLESSSKFGFANGIHQNNLKKLAVQYALKFETLLQILKEDESLSEATKQKLKAFEIDESIENKMYHTIHDNFDLVQEAEDYL